MNFQFPKGFFWGSATSAHQVEGGNINDWSAWEKANAGRLALQSEKKSGRLPVWPEIKDRAQNSQNYISGKTCDHYNRFREDFDIAKSLNQNAHRFSIEWSRIEPEEGKFSEKEISHYREVVKALRERGIEPFITLWHWTIPLWFRDKGGWFNKNAPDYFARYVRIVASVFPEVKFWITLNETNVYAGKGYWEGIRPPQSKSLFRYLVVNRHLSRAHIAAYKIIKTANPEACVGITHHIIYFTRFMNKLKNYFWNHLFFSSIRDCQDFIGLNYYHSDRDTAEHVKFKNWPFDPEGFYFILKDFAGRYEKPIYVIENGVWDEDERRSHFIAEHIGAMAKAMGEGADVRGYFYWSLLDNFEWDNGFCPRFGLVEMDYKTMERKIRTSARDYAKICRDNRI
ncbi:MAG: family 1 glycosylhydrolase [Candidatus Wolfebacteria bacterium]|nr:family 1 glycosylhydrolase [Candidatus Wolfebacteria bacterium]